MKKLIITVALCAITIFSFGQGTWSAKAGMNLSNYTGDLSGMDPVVGFKLGVTYEHSFTDLWLMQTSFGISSKGAKASSDFLMKESGNIVMGYDASARINAYYLELPVMGGIRLPISDKNSVVFTAGPYLAVGIGGKTKADFALLGGDEVVSGSSKESTFGEDGLRRFDMGLGAGVAFEFNRFIVGLESQFGWVKIAEGVGARNVTGSLIVGYKF